MLQAVKLAKGLISAKCIWPTCKSQSHPRKVPFQSFRLVLWVMKEERRMMDATAHEQCLATCLCPFVIAPMDLWGFPTSYQTKDKQTMATWGSWRALPRMWPPTKASHNSNCDLQPMGRSIWRVTFWDHYFHYTWLKMLTHSLFMVPNLVPTEMGISQKKGVKIQG